RGALAALRRDRGRADGLFDGRDLLERDRAGGARHGQLTQLVERRGRLRGGEVDRQRRVVDLDGADALRLHRARDEGADGDLREAELRGRVAVDGHGDVREGRGEVAGDLSDTLLALDGRDDGIRRLGERRGV